MKTTLFIMALTGVAFLASSCSQFGPQETYKEDQIGMTQEVKTGKITSIANVIINPDNTNTGTLLGAVAGGLGGSTLGGGKGSTLFAAGGALAGAAAGSQIDKAVSQQEGVRLTVKLDGENKTMSVTQVKNKKAPFYVGQPVNVYIGYKGSFVEPAGYGY